MSIEKFQECIDACNACAAACDECSTACLGEDDVKMMAGCIALDMDCAQACRQATAYMARGSRFAAEVCRLCADICTACGDECGKTRWTIASVAQRPAAAAPKRAGR